MDILQAAFVNGFERRQFRAFDTDLHPLTLGHVQILAEMGCSILEVEPSFGDHDAAMVAIVCMFPRWEEAREALVHQGFLGDRLNKMVTRYDVHDQAKEVAGFIAYYMTKPANNLASDPMDQRVPWWWSYAEFLQTDMHRTEKAAWGTIVSDAFAYYASFATRNGSKAFKTLRDRAWEEIVSSGKTVKELFEEAGR